MFISDSKEDKALLSRADDIVSISTVRGRPCFLGFLNEREAYILKNYLSWNSDNITFYGGYDDAKRTVLCCCNHHINKEEFPVKAVYFKYRTVDKLTHRDFLGALMSLGIQRHCVGDILVGDGYCVCYVSSEIYDFVVTQITKIGKVGVTIVKKSDCKVSFKQDICELLYTVSSMRLDVVVAAITGESRTKTASIISSGLVFVNYLENKNFSYKMVIGDILTIRGNGKFIIKEIKGVTKKGRLKLLVEHFR